MPNENRPRVVIWGASGHGRVVLDAILWAHDASVVGFIDDDNSRKGESFAGYPVLGGREVLAALLADGVLRIHVAVGHCATRQRIAVAAQTDGFSLFSVVHPRATLARDVSLGNGTFVAAGVVVNAATRLGDNVILNTSCSVDHDCVIEDGAHIAPGARLGGFVHIEEGTFIGIGAIVMNCRRIGKGSLLGAGAVAVSDIPPGVVAYGVPARVIRDNKYSYPERGGRS